MGQQYEGTACEARSVRRHDLPLERNRTYIREKLRLDNGT